MEDFGVAAPEKAADEQAKDTQNRNVQLLIKTKLGWQIWKENEPQLGWYMENNFQAVQMTLRNLPNDYSVMIDMDVPKDSLARVEKAHGDKTLAAEIDKIHGLEAIHRSDAKIIRMDVSLAPEPFKSQKDTRTLELLEKRLIELEMRERARSIDIKVLMEELKSFQIEYYGRLEAMEKKLDEKLEGLQSKCERLAGVVVRYKVAPATVAPSTETDQVAQAAEN